ncbi:hypothetical protein [Halorubellus sp. PRR65]|uniref:hypothetical protein n=1 Tax=Halorubellus sp. PRR65 TaxID=3098148 RepID=UPI002B258BED|nr:hypothetical protein [Halorubellus sp. PRR65]
MPSLLSKASAELGWTALYVGLVVVPASVVFATGAPTQGCHPECVDTVDPTLAIAGLALLVVGVVLAAIGRRFD